MSHTEELDAAVTNLPFGREPIHEGDEVTVVAPSGPIPFRILEVRG